MLATPHMLVGAAVGQAIPNFWAVIILSILLHYLTDALPHLDQNIEGYPNFKQLLIAGVDIVFGIIILYFIFKGQNIAQIQYSVVGAFASLLPDFLDHATPISKYLHRFGPLKKLYQFHKSIHYLVKGKSWVWGVIVQFIVMGLCIWYLIR